LNILFDKIIEMDIKNYEQACFGVVLKLNLFALLLILPKDE
jgi:hypothetical protein